MTWQASFYKFPCFTAQPSCQESQNKCTPDLDSGFLVWIVVMTNHTWKLLFIIFIIKCCICNYFYISYHSTALQCATLQTKNSIGVPDYQISNISYLSILLNLAPDLELFRKVYILYPASQSVQLPYSVRTILIGEKQRAKWPSGRCLARKLTNFLNC